MIAFPNYEPTGLGVLTGDFVRRERQGNIMGVCINRRVLLSTAGATIFAATPEAGIAEPEIFCVTITFRGSSVIPKGNIEIYFRNSTTIDEALKNLVKSDGYSTSIEFILSRSIVSDLPNLQIVARLEREDGWLIARGSTKLDANPSIFINLTPAEY